MNLLPSCSSLTRREFLGAMPLAALVTACNRAPYTREHFSVPAASAIALLPIADYGMQIADAVDRGIQLLNHPCGAVGFCSSRTS